MTTRRSAQAEAARKAQLVASAAETYDRDFVPAPFVRPILAHAAGIGPGESVLDLGCGMGVAALAAADRGAKVTGADANPGMLAVARGKSNAVTWVEAPADSLPFADDSFDVTLCQLARMFPEDRDGALREMARVTRPGGRIAIATWAAVDETPGNDELKPMLGRVVGPAAPETLTAPFILGSEADLLAVAARAGLSEAQVQTVTGTAQLARCLARYRDRRLDIGRYGLA